MFLIKITLGIPFEIILNPNAIATDKFIGYFNKTEFIEVQPGNLAGTWGERIDPCIPYINPSKTWSEKDWDNIQSFILKEKLVRNDPGCRRIKEENSWRSPF